MAPKRRSTAFFSSLLVRLGCIAGARRCRMLFLPLGSLPILACKKGAIVWFRHSGLVSGFAGITAHLPLSQSGLSIIPA
jgi:hypothetical protein